MAALSTVLKISLACFAVTGVTGTPLLVDRNTIGNNALVGFPQTVPSGWVGDAYLRFQPRLKVVNGCQPYPAVDAEGNTNGGLKNTGAESGGCSSSPGQVYGRYIHNFTIPHRPQFTYDGIMYSWYFPKDEPYPLMGHRHDWENTVVWLNNLNGTTKDNIVAVCPSAHGDYKCSRDFSTFDNATAPLIKYESEKPMNHALGFTSDVGALQPLIAWESLPPPAILALSTTNFGAASVPFIDSNYLKNLGKADWF